MKVTDVVDFLLGHITGVELQNFVDREVVEWTGRLRERGRSAAITLVGAEKPHSVTRDQAIRLVDALIKGEFSGATFAYVLNALLISDRFLWSNSDVRDSVESILDLENEGDVDLRDAWRVRERLTAGKVKSLR